ncbi:MAG: ABC transporter permease [Bacteroidota bacterium]
MNVPFFIARRYLFSKKSSNSINIITWVSIVGIGVGTAAIILVLSVFNGLTEFIEDLFSAFDPDVKIVAYEGRYMADSLELYEELANDPRVAAITKTLEGRIGLQFEDNVAYGILKGVEDNFTEVNRLDTFVYDGGYSFAARNGINRAILGSGIAAELNAVLEDEFAFTPPINVFYIPKSASLTQLEASIVNDQVYPAGFFSVQNEYDAKYLVSSLAFTRSLFDKAEELSSYEIRLNNIKDAEEFKSDWDDKVEGKYEILTWYEQHKTLYRVMKNEKYISYLILVLMLAIAAVNIVGGLFMIVIEKKRDIAVLKSFGATEGFIRRIFLSDGLLVGAIGGFLGVSLAFICGIIQIKFGVIKLNGVFRVEAFPVALDIWDFVLVFFTVLFLATLASLYPSRRAAEFQVTEGLKG